MSPLTFGLTLTFFAALAAGNFFIAGVVAVAATAAHWVSQL